MKKGNKVQKLGRRTDQREALVKSQVKDLIERGSIKTTLTRSKAVSRQVDILMDYVIKKNDNKLWNYLTKKELIEKLKKIDTTKKTTGFCTRIKMGPRKGDKAELVLMELVS